MIQGSWGSQFGIDENDKSYRQRRSSSDGGGACSIGIFVSSFSLRELLLFEVVILQMW